jgi:hypothetical protein
MAYDRTMRALILITLCCASPALVPAAHAAEASPATCNGVEGYADSFDGRRTFLLRPDGLRQTAAALAAGGRDPAVDKLLADADKALTAGPWRVTDKTRAPESGDKHDYASMGPYWWPDPDKRDGLPYLRRDGKINPERDSEAFDRIRFENMSDAVDSLSLAYYLTGERKYADRAALVIRTWFLDPATRMNPNMNHAQSIPGKTPGRAEGVIDLRYLIPVVESIGLLVPSEALNDEETVALRSWFSDLVVWMATSPIGREERAAKNNHGLFFDLLITHFALFAGHEDAAKTVLNRFPEQRITLQFAVDGSLPQELARTRSFHYSTWTMAAVYDLATLGECVEVDLWSYKDAEGRGLQSATAFLASYAANEKSWKWPELDMDTLYLYGALRRAAHGYRDDRLWSLSEIYHEKHRAERVNLLYPTPKTPASTTR